MGNVFKKVGSFVGKVVLAVVHGLNKADAAVDADAPEVEKLLSEGASVAKLIPGIGTEVAAVLNAGVELVGAAKATLDGTVAIEPVVLQQIAALAPAGYSIILVEADVAADLKTLIANYEAQFQVAKDAVQTATTAVEQSKPAA